MHNHTNIKFNETANSILGELFNKFDINYGQAIVNNVSITAFDLSKALNFLDTTFDKQLAKIIYPEYWYGRAFGKNTGKDPEDESEATYFYVKDKDGDIALYVSFYECNLVDNEGRPIEWKSSRGISEPTVIVTLVKPWN